VNLAQVKRAVTIARLDKYIETLTEAFEILHGDRGIKLSGGPRQRLGIV
jgi:ATP-binding cassette subfamily B protein